MFGPYMKIGTMFAGALSAFYRSLVTLFVNSRKRNRGGARFIEPLSVIKSITPPMEIRATPGSYPNPGTFNTGGNPNAVFTEIEADRTYFN